MKIAISCESTCDLPKELIKSNNIFVIGLGINFEDDSFIDGENISTAQLFELVDKKGAMPKTSARAVEEYREFFENILKEYDAIIHVGFSSDLSCSYQNAHNASKELKNVYTIDSKNLSSGHGTLVLNACELVREGKTVEEILASLEEIANKISVSFVINTMKYLYKGGRCSTIQYFGANLLKLKPSIVVKEGKMSVGRKYLGRITECAIKYINETLAGAGDVDYSRVFLTYSSNKEIQTDRLASLLVEKGFKEIIQNTAGCTISSHCGPECVGIIFKTK